MTRQLLTVELRRADGVLLDTPDWLNDQLLILRNTEYKRRRVKFTAECKELNPHLQTEVVVKVPPQVRKKKEPVLIKTTRPKKNKMVRKSNRYRLYGRTFQLGPVWSWDIVNNPKKIKDHSKLIAHALFLGLFDTEPEASELHFEELLDLVSIALQDVDPVPELEPISLELDPVLGTYF